MAIARRSATAWPAAKPHDPAILGLLFVGFLCGVARPAAASPIPRLTPAPRAPVTIVGTPVPPAVVAQGPTAPGIERGVEIRLALSEPAARTLSEPRMRRLVEIETASFAVLAPGTVGPLGEHVADVWVAQPMPAKVVVEVRVGDHPVERREIAVRGLAGDVAARHVALAVADMVHAGLAPRGPTPPPPAPLPERTPDAMDRASRIAPALVVQAAVEGAVLPGSSGVIAGPMLSFALRRFGLSEALVGRWLEGSLQGSTARWLELGIALDYRIWISPSFRIAIGGGGGFASVHLAQASAVEGRTGEQDDWSARAGSKLAFELRVARPIWLALDLAPGAILRPVHFMSAPSASNALAGAWLGVGLGAHFELVATPER